MLIRNHVPAVLSLLLLCVAMSGIAQIEPQFKFYLAFEDAKQEKDTVWFGIDSSATVVGFDSIFGDTFVLFDSSSFQVSFGFDDSISRKTIIEGVEFNAWARKIYAISHELPITVRWDTNLLLNHNLPFAIKQVRLKNNYFNELGAGTVDMLKTNTIKLDTFFEGGGIGEHFPMDLIVSITDPPNDVGLNPRIIDGFSVYPNPVASELHIDRGQNERCNYTIIDMQGKTQKSGKLELLHEIIDVTQINSGYYFLVLTTTKSTIYEPVIILKD